MTSNDLIELLESLKRALIDGTPTGGVSEISDDEYLRIREIVRSHSELGPRCPDWLRRGASPWEAQSRVRGVAGEEPGKWQRCREIIVSGLDPLIDLLEGSETLRMQVSTTHVFISYVRENASAVNQIADSLRGRGIEVWLDRDSITPGSRWKREIRRAITEGGFFVACFSAEYSSKGRTYMNEELTIAIEELRQRPTDRAWFIPVMLSACQIPDRKIGAGETLRDIQWVELWRDWDSGMERILQTLLRQRNGSSPSSPTD